MLRDGVWLAGGLLLVLGACDRSPTPPPDPPGRSAAMNAIPEAVPFVEPPADTLAANSTTTDAPTAETATSNLAVPTAATTTATATPTAAVPFGDPRTVIATDPRFRARQQRLEGLVENARSRDANGDAVADYQAALAARDRCGSRSCLNSWYAGQEAALSKWEGAAEILAQPLR